MAYNSYNDEQRQIAVAIVRRTNGNVKAVLPEIRETLDSPRLGAATVRRWYNAAKAGKPSLNPKKVTTACPKCGYSHTLETPGDAASDALKTRFLLAANIHLTRSMEGDAVAELDGLQAIKAAAIAVDKMRLLDGLPTEIVAVLPEFVEVFQAAGFDPAKTMQAMIDRAREASHAQRS